MAVTCSICGRGVRVLRMQRQGAHLRCLLRQRSSRRKYLRLVAISRSGRVSQVYTGSLEYMMRLMARTRSHKCSVVGRCWVERNTEPAVARRRVVDELGKTYFVPVRHG